MLDGGQTCRPAVDRGQLLGTGDTVDNVRADIGSKDEQSTVLERFVGSQSSRLREHLQHGACLTDSSGVSMQPNVACFIH